MTLSYVYKKIKEVMDIIETIDIMHNDKTIKAINQKKLNKAYNILDKFRDELIREKIKNKQNGGNRR